MSKIIINMKHSHVVMSLAAALTASTLAGCSSKLEKSVERECTMSGVDQGIQEQCKENLTEAARAAKNGPPHGWLDDPEKNDTAFDLQSKFHHAGDIMQQEVDERQLYASAMLKITHAIQKIEIRGEQPFAEADIDVDIQSLIPIVRNNKETDDFTGKWNVTITDKGSNASRNFGYDHATHEAEGPAGTTTGTALYNFSYNPRWLSGTGVQKEFLTHGSNRDCRQDSDATTCVIAQAVHDVLNNPSTGAALTPDEIKNIQEMLKKKQAYWSSHSDIKATDQNYTLKAEADRFPEIVIVRKNEKPIPIKILSTATSPADYSIRYIAEKPFSFEWQ